MQRRTMLGAIGAVALATAASFPLTAQAALKGEGGNPIRIVVPYPPGGRSTFLPALSLMRFRLCLARWSWKTALAPAAMSA